MIPCEEALVFGVPGARLVGVLARPVTPPALGVVIVVGGPQYRAGSHRQFVQLARRLAAGGHAALRFDLQGMGDAEGLPAGFEQSRADIVTAVDELHARVPGLGGTVLLGLCDGASAALLALDERPDPRITGLCLLNPWVRTAQSQAAVQVRHYYRERLRSPAFWTKLLSGRVAVSALREAWRALGAMRGGRGRAVDALPFPDRMARAWRAFGRPILLVQSGRDYTAREFDAALRDSPAWAGAQACPGVLRQDVDDADHTFSDPAHAHALETHVLGWLAGLARVA